MREPGAVGDATAAESSLALLARAKAGDHSALETLLSRYRPRLRRWAHRRLPEWAPDLADTDDLVQDTLVKAVRNLPGFVGHAPTGFQNYLRLALGNAVRDQIRRVQLVRPSSACIKSCRPTSLRRSSE